eukprot:Blabericola_migrator_1__10999@NODE_637_length_7124_cov_71_025648_g468_i0_p4_GENE_NODE_637_length_7124_cov_71_025648_g468_i0NODE_637_length_7124_cov_71_025648_g468_i0_p4_ORF_typecomplete_len347_score65_38_NODE_637_length_7124_cov_71_025648_g468_i046615701
MDGLAVKPCTLRTTNVHEVDLEFMPTKESPYPPLVQDFINKNTPNFKNPQIRTASLKDMWFFHGLPHIAKQLKERCPMGKVYMFFHPSTGEIDSFVTTPALELLYGVKNEHGSIRRDEGVYTTMQLDTDLVQELAAADSQKLCAFGHYMNGQVWKDFNLPEPPRQGGKPNEGVDLEDDENIVIFYDASELAPDIPGDPEKPLNWKWISDVDPSKLPEDMQWVAEDTPYSYMVSKGISPAQFLDDQEAINKWGSLMGKGGAPPPPFSEVQQQPFASWLKQTSAERVVRSSEGFAKPRGSRQRRRSRPALPANKSQNSSAYVSVESAKIPSMETANDRRVRLPPRPRQ